MPGRHAYLDGLLETRYHRSYHHMRDRVFVADYHWASPAFWVSQSATPWARSAFVGHGFSLSICWSRHDTVKTPKRGELCLSEVMNVGGADPATTAGSLPKMPGRPSHTNAAIA